MSRNKLSRTSNAKKGIFYGVINKIVVLFCPFAMRLVIIHELGKEFLGLGSLFSSILQVLNLSELGFSTAIIYSLYKPIADNDEKTIGSIMRYYRKIYFIIGCLICAFGILISPFLPKLIKGSYPDGINIYILFYIYLLNTVLSYWLFAYKSALINAYQRTDVISNINTIVNVISYIVQFAVLVITKNYYLFTFVLVLSTVMINIITNLQTNRLFPNIKFEGKIDKHLKDDISEKVKGLLVNKLCVTSRNSFDSIFVSLYLGLVCNAIYNNYYYIMNSVIAIMTIIGVSIQAGVGNSIATETQEKNYNDMNKINFIYMLLSGWCTVFLLCLYQPFTKIAFGKDMMFPNYIVVLFCVYFYVLKMGDIRAIYSDGKGLWWENRSRALVEAVLNLLLNIVLGKLLGVTGIILATLLSLFFINFLWGSNIIFKFYFTSYKVKDYFLSHLKYGTVSFMACFVSYFVCNLIKSTNIIFLLVRLAICFIIPCVIYLSFYSWNKKYREDFAWFLNSLFKRKLRKK